MLYRGFLFSVCPSTSLICRNRCHPAYHFPESIVSFFFFSQRSWWRLVPVPGHCHNVRKLERLASSYNPTMLCSLRRQSACLCYNMCKRWKWRTPATQRGHQWLEQLIRLLVLVMVPRTCEFCHAGPYVPHPNYVICASNTTRPQRVSRVYPQDISVYFGSSSVRSSAVLKRR